MQFVCSVSESVIFNDSQVCLEGGQIKSPQDKSHSPPLYRGRGKPIGRLWLSRRVGRPTTQSLAV